MGRVIKGWDEGLLTMSKGEKAKLTIESDWAYGKKGLPDAKFVFMRNLGFYFRAPLIATFCQDTSELQPDFRSGAGFYRLRGPAKTKHIEKCGAFASFGGHEFLNVRNEFDARRHV